METLMGAGMILAALVCIAVGQAKTDLDQLDERSLVTSNQFTGLDSRARTCILAKFQGTGSGLVITKLDSKDCFCGARLGRRCEERDSKLFAVLAGGSGIEGVR